MAKSTLPTNFKDDILNASMGGKRRYNLINNSDGTVSLEDASTYDQVGSEYGASQVNAANTAVNASADAGKIVDDVDDIGAITEEGYIAGALALKSVNNSLTAGNGQQFQFAYDSESGKYGYMAEVEGADTFCPFKGDVNYIITGLAGQKGETVQYTVPETGRSIIYFVGFAWNTIDVNNASRPGFTIKHNDTSLYYGFPWNDRTTVKANEIMNIGCTIEIDAVKGDIISITCGKVYIGEDIYKGIMVTLY